MVLVKEMIANVNVIVIFNWLLYFSVIKQGRDSKKWIEFPT